jgi:hypothetical protein
MHIEGKPDSGRLTYHIPQMKKVKATTIPLHGLSEYHQWMTSLLKTPPYNKFTYHSI